MYILKNIQFTIKIAYSFTNPISWWWPHYSTCQINNWVRAEEKRHDIRLHWHSQTYTTIFCSWTWNLSCIISQFGVTLGSRETYDKKGSSGIDINKCTSCYLERHSFLWYCLNRIYLHISSLFDVGIFWITATCKQTKIAVYLLITNMFFQCVLALAIVISSSQSVQVGMCSSLTVGVDQCHVH